RYGGGFSNKADWRRGNVNILIKKLHMYEMGLSQAKLSKLLGVSPSRISAYFTGRSEPTLKVAREISRKLNIDVNIVLGV
ncbi:helix-turn-helix domain-containing protein, partial [Bacteroides thetaiotaomicron]|uniref:helix-turn-helix domain-containing protein n=1 Tax=Bacteroides thetaiotaomicron TaxID=818 RepID=UPI001E57BE11